MVSGALLQTFVAADPSPLLLAARGGRVLAKSDAVSALLGDPPTHLADPFRTETNSLAQLQAFEQALESGSAWRGRLCAWAFPERTRLVELELDLQPFMGELLSLRLCHPAGRDELLAVLEHAPYLIHKLGNRLMSLDLALPALEESLGGDKLNAIALRGLRRTTDSLLELQRGLHRVLDADRGSDSRLPLDLRVLGRKLAAQFEPVELEVEAGLRALLSAQALESILEALLDNARRAAAERVALSIRPLDEGRLIEFSVSDDGPGFPEELGGQVFLPFVSRWQRLGYGLPLSYRISAAMGGVLLLEAGPQGGARVRCVLPVRRSG